MYSSSKSEVANATGSVPGGTMDLESQHLLY